MFLGTPVVIQGVNRTIVLLTGQPQIDGGFATVATYLQNRAGGAGNYCLLVKGSGLVIGQKALNFIYVIGEICDHADFLSMVCGMAKVAVFRAADKRHLAIRVSAAAVL
jgi:hypothetical protein